MYALKSQIKTKMKLKIVHLMEKKSVRKQESESKNGGYRKNTPNFP